jgi:hypothetical protein
MEGVSTDDVGTTPMGRLGVVTTPSADLVQT